MRNALRIAALLTVFAVMAYPLIWMLGISLRTGEGVDFRFYREVWQAGPFDRYFLNSLVVVTLVLARQLARGANMPEAIRLMKTWHPEALKVNKRIVELEGIIGRKGGIMKAALRECDYAKDQLELVIVDPEWRRIVPELTQYRMGVHR